MAQNEWHKMNDLLERRALPLRVVLDRRAGAVVFTLLLDAGGGLEGLLHAVVADDDRQRELCLLDDVRHHHSLVELGANLAAGKHPHGLGGEEGGVGTATLVGDNQCGGTNTWAKTLAIVGPIVSRRDVQAPMLDARSMFNGVRSRAAITLGTTTMMPLPSE